MAETIKVKVVGKYNGHNIKPNKAIMLGLKFSYDEMVNCIKLLQMLNVNIDISVKIGDNKPTKLGMFMLWHADFDHDGECAIKLNSQMDYVEADSLNIMAGEEQFTVLFKGEIEAENQEEGDDE